MQRSDYVKEVRRPTWVQYRGKPKQFSSEAQTSNVDSWAIANLAHTDAKDANIPANTARVLPNMLPVVVLGSIDLDLSWSSQKLKFT